ncbi:glycosyltransferase family 2 protein [Enterococcus sp. BWR-S5]|uniref:glycosyltransferase family 2 protein n=1 Tax=Enterococcus sp. BWR-S5 TaxID=2787714 RepID=UPI0019210B12|nr:glycosyltransferase family 2 protein [Enterococcus sp. BWR-S5]MBL1223870.1 glycosyltransferase family 2 protein [Enterococcus sp. BWR-S5]
MISVCVAAYNGEKYIAQQLDSILIQLAEEDEVIVSDDGSVDGTLEILEEYAGKDSRVRLIEGPRNGVIANFEQAITEAQGDFIFLADQDDVWLPEKVSETVAFFNAHLALDVVVSDLIIVNEKLEPITSSYFEYRKVKTGFFANVLKNGYIGAGMCFRKRMKERILPIPHNVPMHDMWIGLLGETGFLQKPLTYYRRHDENVSEIATSASLLQQLNWRTTLLYLLFKRKILKR